MKRIFYFFLLFLFFSTTTLFGGLPPLKGKGFWTLSHYPTENLWRLFVDGSLQEKESGFLGYLDRGREDLRHHFELINYMVTNYWTLELGVDLLHTFHKKLAPEKGGKWKGAPNQFFLSSNNYSADGLSELVSFLIEAHDQYALHKAGFYLNQDRLGFKNEEERFYLHHRLSKWISEKKSFYYIPPYVDSSYKHLRVVDRFVEKKITSFKEEIARAVSDEESYLAIIRLVQALERLHPYYDFNNRTFVNHLFIFLCLKYDLIIPTFYEPNVFDAYSQEEVLTAVIKGIQTTLKIICKEDGNVFFGRPTYTMEELSIAFPQHTFSALLDLQWKISVLIP